MASTWQTGVVAEVHRIHRVDVKAEKLKLNIKMGINYVHITNHKPTTIDKKQQVSRKQDNNDEEVKSTNK